VSENIPYNGYTFSAPRPNRYNIRQIPSNRYSTYVNNRLTVFAQVGVTLDQARNVIESLSGKIIGQQFMVGGWFFIVEVPVCTFDGLFETADEWYKMYPEIFENVFLDIADTWIMNDILPSHEDLNTFATYGSEVDDYNFFRTYNDSDNGRDRPTNDPVWGLSGSPDPRSWSLHSIDAPRAWRLFGDSFNSSEISIGVMDTGIHFEHNDIT